MGRVHFLWPGTEIVVDTQIRFSPKHWESHKRKYEIGVAGMGGVRYIKNMLDATAHTAATATANILSDWAGDILKRSESDVFIACKQASSLLETAWNQADEYQRGELRVAIGAFQDAIDTLKHKLERAGM
jgi:hypothetical protein